ncbi:hypothetical protein MK805_01510 [Shimazuella sp. AN120528]|uniref:hypothetical protein n=1 Tax=Shimazuella soli TaxID=1892854 RepID=UPI001F0D66E7|nr:hypothetical protein [Shimazuella soli]
MKTVDIIRKKRDGQDNTAEEIRYLVRGFAEGNIPDYQISAWAMAAHFKGLSILEKARLQLVTLEHFSVNRVDLSKVEGIKRGYGRPRDLRVSRIIRRKRNGRELSTREIRYLISGYTNGKPPSRI